MALDRKERTKRFALLCAEASCIGVEWHTGKDFIGKWRRYGLRAAQRLLRDFHTLFPKVDSKEYSDPDRDRRFLEEDRLSYTEVLLGGVAASLMRSSDSVKC